MNAYREHNYGNAFELNIRSGSNTRLSGKVLSPDKVQSPEKVKAQQQQQQQQSIEAQQQQQAAERLAKVTEAEKKELVQYLVVMKGQGKGKGTPANSNPGSPGKGAPLANDEIDVERRAARCYDRIVEYSAMARTVLWAMMAKQAQVHVAKNAEVKSITEKKVQVSAEVSVKEVSPVKNESEAQEQVQESDDIRLAKAELEKLQASMDLIERKLGLGLGQGGEGDFVSASASDVDTDTPVDREQLPEEQGGSHEEGIHQAAAPDTDDDEDDDLTDDDDLLIDETSPLDIFMSRHTHNREGAHSMPPPQPRSGSSSPKNRRPSTDYVNDYDLSAIKLSPSDIKRVLKDPLSLMKELER